MKKGEQRTMNVTCAWCRGVISEGSPPVSHGICARCAPGFMAEVERAAARKADDAEPSVRK
jgi:hypothetical protein